MAIYNSPRDPVIDPINPNAANERVLTRVDRRSGFSPFLGLILAIAALALAYLYVWPGRDAADLNGRPTTTTSVPENLPPAQNPNP